MLKDVWSMSRENEYGSSSSLLSFFQPFSLIESPCKGLCHANNRFCLMDCHFLSFRLVLIEALDSILSNHFSSSKMSSACPSSRYGHVAVVINDEMLVWGGVAVRESKEVLLFSRFDRVLQSVDRSME